MPPNAVSDEELCERIARGDHAALEPLYRRHAGDIVRYLTLLGAPSDWVEDGTHEVFLKVWTAYLNVLSCFLTLAQSFTVFRFGSLSDGLASPASR